MLAENVHPEYKTPQEILQNQALARARANQGLPSAVYNKAMQDIGRNTNNAIRLSNDRRGGLSTISTVTQAANDANLKLDMADANQKLQNERQLIDVNNNVARYRDKEFDWNKRDAYERKYNYGMQLLGAGNQNVTNALDRGVAAATQFGASGGFNNFFGGGGKKSSSALTSNLIPSSYSAYKTNKVF
jgi:hypothetical protein